MKNLAITLCFVLIGLFQLSAQTDEEWTTTKKPVLFEKLYFQLDREIYAQGDSIWMKLYHVNGISHQLNANYRNIYVQLIAENGSVAREMLLFSMDGQAQGMLSVGNLDPGVYTIRASTKYLENYGEQALFHKKIWITRMTGPTAPVENVREVNNCAEVAFLPEGGNTILNAANALAFKAIDDKGKGVNVSGKIISDAGDTILSFKSTYKGMGKVIYMPVDGSSYFAVVDQNPALKIMLPQATAEGVHLNCRDQGDAFRFVFSANMKKEGTHTFFFTASHKGTEATRKIVMEGPTHTLTLSKDLFPVGITKITLSDESMQPFAERLIFVEKEEEEIISLEMNKNKFKQREKVSIQASAFLSEMDSIISPLSVAIVNRNYFDSEGATQNIKSYLLLDSELKGAIESPASFFVDDKITSAQKLDLLMMVNGWRTYLWDDVKTLSKAATEEWNDAGIEIKGFVKKLLWKAPLSDAALELSYVYRNYSLGKTTSNANGRFTFGRVFFQDSTEVMINATTKEGSRNLEIKLDPQFTFNSVVDAERMKNTCPEINFNRNYDQDNAVRQQNELAFYPEKGTILLDGIDITASKESAFTRSFGEYMWTDKTILVGKEDQSYPYLVDYLMDKIPSFMRDDSAGFIMKHKPVEFKIDNYDFDAREMEVIRMQDIVQIDILDPGFRRTRPGTLGVVDETGLIAAYRKDAHKVPVDYFNKKGRIRPEIRGFHKPVRFYSPTYNSINISDPRPDYRPTLLWDPNLKFDNEKATIDFFTSDQLASYVVFVEGITKEGRICYATTSFNVDRD